MLACLALSLSLSAQGGASRRAVVAGAASVAPLVIAPLELLAPRAALAAEAPSRMGGALEPYIETSKGFKLYKPVSWNQFDADPGVYDIKFSDLIEPFETVQVSTSPVSTATSVSALGDLAAVGDKFAKSRSAELVSSSERDADGSLAYTFDLKGETYRELLLLTVNRGKLYRLSCVATNKRWPKRAELYKNVALSFVPKGF